MSRRKVPIRKIQQFAMTKAKRPPGPPMTLGNMRKLGVR
jgi:hypothetical protein